MKNKSLLKRLLCGVAALTMLFNLCACSGKEEQEPQTQTTSEPQSVSETTTQEIKQGSLNPLTGTYDLADSAVGTRPTAVVVENSPAARPQWGLSTPDILVEGLVEGGITRMLLLYSDVSKIPKVGPIRSARHDFVEIAECFDSIFVHCGWSTYAQSKIKADKVNNLNGIQGYTPKFFYRDSSRASKGTEHTGYSNGKYIAATVSALKYRTEVKSAYANVLSFNAAESEVTPSAGACSSVKFSYSSSNNHTLTYDSGKKIYLDSLNGSARKDADSVQLSFKNILVLYCKVVSMGDSKGCIDMKLENSNTGYYISDGGYETVSWTKTGSASSSKLVIKDSSGNAVKLNAGNTYIALVPTSQKSATTIN